MATRTPAMRVRLDLAMEVNPAEMSELLDTAKAINDLKEAAKELGFILTADVDAKLGTIEVKDKPNGE